MHSLSLPRHRLLFDDDDADRWKATSMLSGRARSWPTAALPLLSRVSLQSSQVHLHPSSNSSASSQQLSVSPVTADTAIPLLPRIAVFVMRCHRNSLAPNFYRLMITDVDCSLQRKTAASTSTSTPTLFPRLLRTSVLSAPARRVSATPAPPSTVSSLISCFRVVILPVVTYVAAPSLCH